jgi:LmbE family N-acetylglucosaminyl deacetylase
MGAQAGGHSGADLIVLSPHLDDGILSCGGRIAKITAGGGRALIVTFFTGEPTLAEIPASLRRFCDYRERKAEDSRAAAVLGADVRWLDFVERAFRPPSLPGFQAVFRTPPLDQQALAELEQVEAAIAELLAEHPSAEVLAPLAVGHHIDHVVLFLAAVRQLLAQQAFDRLRFYEDAYALGALARRQHFVTRRRRWSWRQAPERQSLRARAMFAALALARRGRPVERLLPPAARSWSWRCAADTIAGFEAQKLAAVLEYRSQIAIFGGDRAWCELLKRYHRCWGGGEPVWWAIPPAELAERAANR